MDINKNKINIKFPKTVLSLIIYLIKNKKFDFFIYSILNGFIMNCGHSIFVPLLTKYTIDNINNLSTTKIIICIIAFVAMEWGSCVNGVVMYFQYKFSIKQTEKLKCDIFKYLINQNIDYFNNNFSGSINAKINNITDYLVDFINCLFEFIQNILLAIITLILIIRINYNIGIFIILWLIPFLIILKIFIKKLANITKIAEEKTDNFYGIINDDIINVLNIKIFSNENYENERLIKNSKDVLKCDWSRSKIRAGSNLFNYLFISIFSLVILLICSYVYYKNLITLGTFFFILTSIKTMASNMGFSFSILLPLIFDLYGFILDGLTLFEKDNSIVDKNDAIDLTDVKGKIVFKNVNFNYK